MRHVAPILGLLLLIGRFPCAYGQNTNQRAQQDSANWHITEWGQIYNGIQMRVSTKKKMDPWGELETVFEFRTHPGQLPPRCGYFGMGGSATLAVYDLTSGFSKQFRRSTVPSRPSIEQTLTPLSRPNRIEPATVSFQVDFPIEPETVELLCQVEFLAKHTDDSVWSGLLISPTFRVLVERHPLGKDTLLMELPNKICFAYGPQLAIDSTSLDTVVVEYGKGNIVSSQVKGSSWTVTGQVKDSLYSICKSLLTDNSMIRNERPALFPSVYENGIASRTYRVALYESETLPEYYHGMISGAKLRKIWYREWEVIFDKRVIDSLTPPEPEPK